MAGMHWNITEKTANQILAWLDLGDYEVTDIYEQSFRAYRKNEYILSELNVELTIDPQFIDAKNVYQMASQVTHVLKRFK